MVDTPLINPGLHITLDRRGAGSFVVDAPAWPGTPYVGLGATVHEALGLWLLANRSKLGIVVDVLPAAEGDEYARLIIEGNARDR